MPQAQHYCISPMLDAEMAIQHAQPSSPQTISCCQFTPFSYFPFQQLSLCARALARLISLGSTKNVIVGSQTLRTSLAQLVSIHYPIPLRMPYDPNEPDANGGCTWQELLFKILGMHATTRAPIESSNFEYSTVRRESNRIEQAF